SPAAILAAEITGEREGHFVDKIVRPVVILNLDAVVGMDTRAPKSAVASAQSVFSHTIVVKDEREPGRGTPQDLSAQTGFAAQPPVGLPAVDDPRLDLQLGGREPLNAEAVEEPGSIRRYIGWLVGPVIEVVVAEQADIRNENAGIEVQPVVYVEVI